MVVPPKKISPPELELAPINFDLAGAWVFLPVKAD